MANGSREWGHLPSVRAHVRFLIDPTRPKDKRFSLRGLARHVGMNFAGLWKLHQGQTKRVSRHYADLIMATSLYDLPASKSQPHDSRNSLVSDLT